MSRRGRKSIGKRLLPAAISAAILIALSLYGMGVTQSPADEVYLAKVAAAIDAIPYKVGNLIGTDMQPTPAAVKLLKPNRILERNYLDPHTRESASLLVVHCADARDMLGHYPPVCYPAHGWIAVSSAHVQVMLQGKPFQATVYKFSKGGTDVDQKMTVVSFFVLPGTSPPIMARWDELERAARSPGSAGQGAAQVQVVTTAWHEGEGAGDIASRLLKVIEPVVRSIAGEYFNE